MGFFCTYVMNINYIKETIEPDVEKLGYKVWGLELFGRQSNQTLRIYIDNEKGISLEDCEVVSKHISKVLELCLYAYSPLRNPLSLYLFHCLYRS